MIRLLEKHIADKIAAGEVVERPLSIIKELIENSIDANSTKIAVEIKNGGKTYIRVTDNGTGIERNDVSKAFLRHSTSKISSEKDLDNILTLGFRGEALASISAVSRVELTTKHINEDIGSRISIFGGEIVDEKSVGAAGGTTIVIKDLFFNTPARLKFLKSQNAESSSCIEYVMQMAIAYPNIKFMMINNDKILFSTSGNGNTIEAIATVTSNIEAKNLIPIDFSQEGIQVKGFIGKPNENKASKKSQIFFVNGRVINSKVIEKGLYEGYSERIFPNRHPIAYIFLSVNPFEIDVNIHPNKKEVRFYQEEKVIGAIKKAVVDGLNREESLSEIKIKDNSKIYENYTNTNKVADSVDIDKNYLNHTEVKESPTIQNYLLESLNTNRSDKYIPENKIANQVIDVDKIIEKYNDIKLKKEKESLEIQEKFSFEDKKKNENINKKFDFSDFNIIGQAFSTYIILEDGDNLYFLDQHAAHERVFFEKFKNEYESVAKNSQLILSPILVTPPRNIDIIFEEWSDILVKLGFILEEFGEAIYRVTAIPTLFSLEEGEKFLEDFFDNIDEFGSLKDDSISDKLATRACKIAIKGNDILKVEEIEQLLNILGKCDNPLSCPHGRPTFIKMTKYEMERKFKRS